MKGPCGRQFETQWYLEGSRVFQKNNGKSSAANFGDLISFLVFSKSTKKATDPTSPLVKSEISREVALQNIQPRQV